MGERFRGDDSAAGRRAGGTTRTVSEEGIDSDTLHAVLDHPRRRLILDAVTELSTATARDVATQVAARERDRSPQDVTDEQRREVTIALHHVHVPKLADIGVLEVEGEMERLRPGPKATVVMEVVSKLYGDLGAGNDESMPDA